MRVVRFAAFGDPAEVVRVEDHPLTAPGPGQVLLRMLVRPINPSDLFTIRGQYGRLPRLPATPGLEGSGRIETLGPGVEGFEVGQLVVPLGVGGTWQEYLVANAASLIPVPAGFSERDAAMLVVNPSSAWLLLHEVLCVEPGGWLVQNAANSAVGRFIIRLARRSGVHTINIVRRRELHDDLMAEGADVVLYEDDPQLLQQIAQIVGPRGVRYALDSVAGASGSRLIQALGTGGRMVVFGAISRQPLTIDPGALIFRNIKLHGWWLAEWFRSANTTQVEDLLTTLHPLVANGTLRAPIAAEYSLEAVQQAVVAAEASERQGKILLVG